MHGKSLSQRFGFVYILQSANEVNNEICRIWKIMLPLQLEKKYFWCDHITNFKNLIKIIPARHTTHND